MGTKYHKTLYLWWNILMLLAILNTISQGLVESLRPLDKTKFGPAPRGTIKTIEVPEDGDVIDCVDIYKQPAFSDPLIKKDFQMIPRKAYDDQFNRTKNPHSNIFQNWNRYGECPKGSIPIRRTWNSDRTIHQKTGSDGFHHEYAAASQYGSLYNGAAATFNTWNPRVIGKKEFSLTQLWVLADRNPPRNSIECGWIVSPHRYHDTQTRLFTYWTGDNYNKTGCFDLKCAGFVQTSSHWVVGGVINPVSTYKGQQYEMRVSVSRVPETGRWWLELQGMKLGYFPAFKFPSLRNGADRVDFGGEIINQNPGNKHTGTHMGSGHFPEEGWEKASYVRNIEVTNLQNQVMDARLRESVTRPECYNFIFGPPNTNYRQHFYYGGPGYSTNCVTPTH